MRWWLTRCGLLSKKQKQCAFEEVERGNCWIAISLAQASGLILAARVGKHTDNLLAALLHSTEGKTDGQKWSTDGWGGSERVLPSLVEHHQESYTEVYAHQWDSAAANRTISSAAE